MVNIGLDPRFSPLEVNSDIVVVKSGKYWTLEHMGVVNQPTWRKFVGGLLQAPNLLVYFIANLNSGVKAQ